MRELTQQSLHNTVLRYRAQSIIDMYFPVGPVDYIKAVRNFIIANVRLVNESDEVLVSPLKMFEEIDRRGYTSGDCDDVSMLGAALLIELGIPCRFKAIIRAPAGYYTHVFLECLKPALRTYGIWIPVDFSSNVIPAYEPGDCIVQEI